jgi:putative ABC transport system substrate-binding protein
VHRVAVLQNAESATIKAEVEQMRRAAPEIGIELTIFSAAPADIEGSLTSLEAARLDGLIIPDDPVLETLLQRLIALAARKHLPALYGFSTATKLGGLMSYSADFFTMWRRTAGYVDRILKGARPAELPVEQATEVLLNINIKTARTLDLSIPQTLLATANEVIE